MQHVVDETIALFHWLAWVADQIYGSDARGASRRWVLRAIFRHGPQTVPALARTRAIRRQTLQPVVDALEKERFVTLERNPAHARSRLVVLTRQGAELVERLDHIDARVLGAVSRGISPRALDATATTLRALRSGFENEARWRAAAETST